MDKKCFLNKEYVIGVLAIGVAAFCLTKNGYNAGIRERETSIEKLKDWVDDVHAQNVELMNQINKLQDKQ